MEFDELMTNHLGPFGKFQGLCLLGHVFHAFPYFVAVVELVFMGKVPQHYCTSIYPGHILQTKWNLTQEQIVKLTSPGEEYESGQQCHIIDRNWANVTQANIDYFLSANGNYSSDVEAYHLLPCQQQVYNDTEWGKTLVERYDLACGSEWLLATAQTCFLAGMMVGVLLFGWLSDWIGRRTSILSALTLTIFARIFTIFAPSIALFSFARFLNGMGSFGWYTVGFVWGLEMTAPKWRSTIAVSSTYAFTLSYTGCAVMAYLVKNYQYLILYNMCFYAPYILYYWLLPESPRWLYAVGRTEEGEALVKRIAEINKRELPAKLEIIVKDKQKNRNPLVLLKTREMRKRTIASSIIWFSTSLVSYGILLNTVNIVGSVYLNVAFMGLVSLVATGLPMFMVEWKWLGRRLNILGPMFLCGVALLLMIPVPKSMPALAVTLYQLGNTFSGIVFNVIYLHTPETMPTEVRSMGMSLANAMARVGGMISPFIALVGTYNSNYPNILLGCVALVAGFAVFLLPETRGKTLPDTIAEVEESTKKSAAKFELSKEEERKRLDVCAI